MFDAPSIRPARSFSTTGVVIGSEIFVLGGANTDNHYEDTNDVQVFNTVTGKWRNDGRMPGERSHHECSTQMIGGYL